MNITLNGKAYALATPLSVAALAQHLHLSSTQVAIERNGEIVPRSTYSEVMVGEGDIIEIVTFIGGG